MPDITLTLDAQALTAVVDAYCANEGYKSQIPDGSGGFISNPETRGQFAKRMVIKGIREYVKQYKLQTSMSDLISGVESLSIT